MQELGLTQADLDKLAIYVREFPYAPARPLGRWERLGRWLRSRV